MRIVRRTAVVCLAIVAIGYGVWIAVSRNPTSAFANAVHNTDRIVVHGKGFEEHLRGTPTVFLEITDPNAIAEFNSHIRFQRTVSGSQCACTGFPGIDWYRNGERVVFTGMQHKTRIRWAPFDYDLPLTDSSSAWIEAYLTSHHVPLVGLAEIDPWTPENLDGYKKAMEEIPSASQETVVEQ